jgi:hypothetical protein
MMITSGGGQRHEPEDRCPLALSSSGHDRAHWLVSLMVEVAGGSMDGAVELPDI